MQVIGTSLLSLAMVLMTTSAMASSPVWHWKSLSSGVDVWTIRGGDATVSMSKGRFVASLIDADDGHAAYVLKGKMTGDAITAVATIADSDVPPVDLSGRYRINHWREAGGGRETIVLTDGFEVIALTREFPATSPPN